MREVDLDEHRQHEVDGDRGAGEAFEEIEAVNGLDSGEGARNLVGLVGLEGTDQVPADGEVGGVGELAESFLHAVLAEVDLSGGVRRTDGVGAEGLADGNETDGLGRPSAADRGAGDA